MKKAGKGQKAKDIRKVRNYDFLLAFFFLFIVACVGFSGYNQVGMTGNVIYDPAPQNLVAYYPLDGNLSDSSGNGNDGTWGGVVNYSAGVFGSSAYFNGDYNSADDYLSIPYSSSLDYLSSDGFTISVWIKSEDFSCLTATRQVILSNWPSTNDVSIYLASDLNGHCRLEAYVSNIGSIVGNNDLFGSNNNGINEWFLVTFVGNYTGSSYELKLYKDGIMINSSSIAQIKLNSIGMSDFFIGDSANFFYAREFYGSIDEVRFYNRSLTSQEILDYYNSVGLILDSHACNSSIQCKSAFCSSIGICGNQSLESSCGVDSDCNSFLQCNLTSNKCSSVPNGFICTLNDQCLSNYCNPIHLCSSTLSSNMSGNGSLISPYVITDCVQLQRVKESLKAYYVLGNDINCSDTVHWNFNRTRGIYEGFEPIATSKIGYYFGGSLDGTGHTISDLYFNRTDICTGLFGLLSGNVTNLTLLNVNYSSSAQEVGGIAGCIGYYENPSVSIDHVSVIGKIVCIQECGGIAGIVLQTSTAMNDSSITIDFTEDSNFVHTGDIVGSAYGGSNINNTVNGVLISCLNRSRSNATYNGLYVVDSYSDCSNGGITYISNRIINKFSFKYPQEYIFSNVTFTNSNLSNGPITLFNGSAAFNTRFNTINYSGVFDINSSVINNSTIFDSQFNNFRDSIIVNSNLINLTNSNIYSSNLTNVSLEWSNGLSKILFFNNINATNLNTSKDLILNDTFAFVNSTNQPGMNVSANITFNLGSLAVYGGLILRDGIPCDETTNPSCYNFTSLSGVNLVKFNVSSWSNYSLNGTFQQPCGNNILEPQYGEVCDGPSFGGLTCSTYNFNQGSLSCYANCTVDNSGCSNSTSVSNNTNNNGNAGTGGSGGGGGGGGSSIPKNTVVINNSGTGSGNGLINETPEEHAQRIEKVKTTVSASVITLLVASIVLVLAIILLLILRLRRANSIGEAQKLVSNS